jgi:SAM-dependent methyltransferase
MIEKCRIRLESRKNAEIFLGSIEDMPYQPKAHDIVLCHQVFPHFDDKPLAVRLLADTLKPDGTFIIFHFKNSSWINDLHRKTDPSIIADLIPTSDEMNRMFQAASMKIDTFEDDDQGYCLSASFSRI